MLISVSSQALVFLWSVVGGMVIAFVFDLFRIKRKAVKTCNLIVYIEDLVYWIIVALVMFTVIYYSNEGEIRGYLFIGTIIGVVLYVVLLSRVIIGFTMLVIRIITKIIALLWMILSYPFKIIFKILAVPGRLIGKGTAKAFRKARRAGRSGIKRMAMWTRILKNIRKKI